MARRKTLAHLTGLAEERCETVLQEGLLGGYLCERNPDTGFPAFAFRLHQFISRGDTVYASLEGESDRFITVNGQQFVPGDRDAGSAASGFLPGVRAGILFGAARRSLDSGQVGYI